MIRRLRLDVVLVACSIGLLASAASSAQSAQGAVSIAAEPNHKIRFDNGRVRMYEVVLQKGQATLMHEHRADSFSVFFRKAEATGEPNGGKPSVFDTTPGAVGFASTAKGPYSHRVIASGDGVFHVIAMELLASPAGPTTTSQRVGPAFKLALENSRGRVYRITLAPGESTATFMRPAGSALVAISAGRISEAVAGKRLRLWDFEPGRFQWFETGEALAMKNESSAPVELVEIEVF